VWAVEWLFVFSCHFPFAVIVQLTTEKKKKKKNNNKRKNKIK
jgi:hypothetical protein